MPEGDPLSPWWAFACGVVTGILLAAAALACWVWWLGKGIGEW